MRRIPTADDRVMQRARISVGDMHQAVAFIDAALALEARGATSLTDVTDAITSGSAALGCGRR